MAIFAFSNPALKKRENVKVLDQTATNFREVGVFGSELHSQGMA